MRQPFYERRLAPESMFLAPHASASAMKRAAASSTSHASASAAAIAAAAAAAPTAAPTAARENALHDLLQTHRRHLARAPRPGVAAADSETDSGFTTPPTAAFRFRAAAAHDRRARVGSPGSTTSGAAGAASSDAFASASSSEEASLMASTAPSPRRSSPLPRRPASTRRAAPRPWLSDSERSVVTDGDFDTDDRDDLDGDDDDEDDEDDVHAALRRLRQRRHVPPPARRAAATAGRRLDGRGRQSSEREDPTYRRRTHAALQGSAARLPASASDAAASSTESATSASLALPHARGRCADASRVRSAPRPAWPATTWTPAAAAPPSPPPAPHAAHPRRYPRPPAAAAAATRPSARRMPFTTAWAVDAHVEALAAGFSLDAAERPYHPGRAPAAAARRLAPRHRPGSAPPVASGAPAATAPAAAAAAAAAAPTTTPSEGAANRFLAAQLDALLSRERLTGPGPASVSASALQTAQRRARTAEAALAALQAQLAQERAQNHAAMARLATQVRAAQDGAVETELALRKRYEKQIRRLEVDLYREQLGRERHERDAALLRGRLAEAEARLNSALQRLGQSDAVRHTETRSQSTRLFQMTHERMDQTKDCLAAMMEKLKLNLAQP
ncbi:hypothetical protein CXG81DRAFT_26785 [Caulochytrium protostelioides]|uniref:Uncharacterized protein n=1 Tax=Caulochytrium protostelioides TaxID=1555241 RepID=A0A4P9X5V0_9FUNG|nr:hypothetical protein CXG81DRAFT_26785 [Caulochytrium protostelioides]|eukprot:RKP00512.1 hypothetical protein CXG81DRAFT_26785 [Caulochytrium protostelioides]